MQDLAQSAENLGCLVAAAENGRVAFRKIIPAWMCRREPAGRGGFLPFSIGVDDLTGGIDDGNLRDEKIGKVQIQHRHPGALSEFPDQVSGTYYYTRTIDTR